MRKHLFLVALIAPLAFGSPASAMGFLDSLVRSAPPAPPASAPPKGGAPAPSAPAGGYPFGGIFSGKSSGPAFGPPAATDQQYDAQVLWPEDVSPNRIVPAAFRRQTVAYQTTEQAGTIVVDTGAHFLYLVEGNGQALRYGVGVGRIGFGWKGTVHVGNMAEWPGWTPPPQMITREAARGNILPAHMDGGPDNPLGARALYLYGADGDTGYRIHGTSQPWTIGLDVSSGCIRLNNDDVTDLYSRVQVGAKVIVM
jgi:lipoprotein-anchoring transpeptidase ErfK/SrfK